MIRQCREDEFEVVYSIVNDAAEADWAVRFYANRGFRQVSPEVKNRLLKKYWSIPERQVETSVVLADSTWWERHPERP
ncbi:MAG: hypothetical protein JXB62_21285 [Pirellulales bacterium]|nr:hypothetical protein [Pirellulales bacterium]